MTNGTRFVSAAWAIVIVVMAAVIGAAGINPAALAQQAKSAGIAADDLFWPNTPDFKPGAGAVARLVNFVKQAQSPGSQCPTDVDFTVMGGLHPDGPLMSEALAAARRDAIAAVLKGFGPSVRITAKTSKGLVSMVSLNAQSAKDNEKPKLDTNSVPRKGKKVKAGDKITVTMVARDHANLWQSGIKTIQLVAESEGGRFIASENYPPAPSGCTALPPERRVEATYTVPSNPPPIVRLAALAEDYAGHMDTDVGEFPTKGDWYGRIDWSSRDPNSRRWGRLELTFDYDRQGNLTGQIAGDEYSEMQWPKCRQTAQMPAKLSANLVGQYTPGRNTMSLRVADPQVEMGKFTMNCGGPEIPGRTASGGPLHQPGLAQLLNSLTVRADGSVEASGEWPATPTSPQMTLHMKLYPTQN
jgi:hypothetical protein